MPNRYHCDVCKTESHDLSGPAEVQQMQAVHVQVRHSSVIRNNQPRTTTDTGRQSRRR
ncbi:hypothetical protein [Candidatus Frankia nodulisporulans]|uniref:hypothetical protein n=1 Tax=Candidatus Frankia nodulisporulans TaxID=2060052 RepID=UPI0013D7FBB0|nr:hypothetical protein [Candidatus Frankia nodulisporulans]